MPRSKKITLKSSDGKPFRVNEAVASKSLMIKHVIEEACYEDAEIPLANVTAKILVKVLEYCEKHVDASNDLQAWDANFVEVHYDTIFDIIIAASYLNIESLVDLTCQAVADKLKGKNPDEIRKILKIKSDYTPEEEEEVRRENQWAFE